MCLLLSVFSYFRTLDSSAELGHSLMSLRGYPTSVPGIDGLDAGVAQLLGVSRHDSESARGRKGGEESVRYVVVERFAAPSLVLLTPVGTSAGTTATRGRVSASRRRSQAPGAFKSVPARAATPSATRAIPGSESVPGPWGPVWSRGRKTTRGGGSLAASTPVLPL